MDRLNTTLITLLVTLLFSLSCVHATGNWMHASEQIEMELSISSTLHITKTQPTGQIDTLTATLHFIPHNTAQQDTQNLKTSPHAEIDSRKAVFRWDSPTESNLPFSLTADLKNTNTIPQVRKKTPFPYLITDASILRYTESQKIINSDDPRINAAASKIVEGEDDLYLAVAKLAHYVMDTVSYELDNPEVAIGTKEATWVLEHKIGVCDEMTTLFAALARSLGIPVKYVSGLAYTTMNNLNDWGPHAWAEVYFPDAGWVPYDVTYREIGYVDATHIKLLESLDADDSSTEYEWRGRSIDVSADSLKLEVKRKQERGIIRPVIRIETRMLREQIGFGSYNIIEARITNLLDQYITTEISLSQTIDLEIAGTNRKIVSLTPKGDAALYWLVQTSQDLDPRFIYTFPILAYSTRNTTSETSFQTKEGFPSHTKEEMETLLQTLEKETKKSYSQEISLDCLPDKDSVLSFEDIGITCAIKNRGNTILQNIKVCLHEDCRITTLGIGQEDTIRFTPENPGEGIADFSITAKNLDISRHQLITITIKDQANIAVTSFTHPETVSYSETFEIEAIITQASRTVPTDVRIILAVGGITQEWTIDTMDQDQKFILSLRGLDLSEGKNPIQLTIHYSDLSGQRYKTEHASSITLTGLTVWQKIMVRLYAFERWIRRA